jgi:hypothetical protein
MSGIFHATYSHDDGCKTLLTRNMDDCKCNCDVKIEKAPNDKFTEDKIKDDLTNWKREQAKYN